MKLTLVQFRLTKVEDLNMLEYLAKIHIIWSISLGVHQAYTNTQIYNIGLHTHTCIPQHSGDHSPDDDDFLSASKGIGELIVHKMSIGKRRASPKH